VQINVAQLPTRAVRYLEAGSGKRAIVFLHAFPLSADQWMPQLARVPQGWRAIAPDLRGFRGMGPAFEPAGIEGVTVDDYATDVLALMSHADVDRAVVCGSSMGGYVALALHRLAPERLRGLILANSRATADSDVARAGRDAMRDLALHEGAAGIARVMLPKLLGATTTSEQPDLVQAVRDLIAMNAPEVIAAAVGALKSRPDATPQLPAITRPVLVIGGEEDVITPPPEQQATAAAIAGSTCVILPRVGHLSNLENPAAFNAVVTEFLAAI
jgi:pimeloyl-ACP methyl ester carboxylesterase